VNFDIILSVCVKIPLVLGTNLELIGSAICGEVLGKACW